MPGRRIIKSEEDPRLQHRSAVAPGVTANSRQQIHCTGMTAASPAPDPAAIAALPAIALALRQGDGSSCEHAAVRLRDLVTKAAAEAAGDAQAAVCGAIANNGEVVDAAFVQALGRQGLSDAAQRALVLTMMSLYMKFYDVCNDPSSAMMQASFLFLPILLRIISQEQPVSTCRCRPPPPPFNAPRRVIVCPAQPPKTL